MHSLASLLGALAVMIAAATLAVGVCKGIDYLLRGGDQ